MTLHLAYRNEERIKSEIIRLYWEKKLPMAEVAKKLQVSAPTIMAWMKKLEIPHRTPREGIKASYETGRHRPRPKGINKKPRKEIKCVVCGKIREVVDGSSHQAKTAKFCSHKCWGEYIKSHGSPWNRSKATQRQKETLARKFGRERRICSICKKDFWAGKKNYSQKYCSPRCRYLAHRTRICQVCGKSFLGQKQNKYCSKECGIKASNKRRKQRLERIRAKTCLNCERVFIAPDKKAKFCSQKCEGEYRRNPSKRIICQNCGKIFIANLRKDQRQFCSRKCYSKWNSKFALGLLKLRRKNWPYWFMDVPFDSNQERKVAKWLHHNIGFIPIEGVNCHIRMNGGEIDFRISEWVFLEYHPFGKDGLDIFDDKIPDEYYTERRKLLDKNGYKDISLLLITNLKQLDKVAPFNLTKSIESVNCNSI